MIENYQNINYHFLYEQYKETGELECCHGKQTAAGTSKFELKLSQVSYMNIDTLSERAF